MSDKRQGSVSVRGSAARRTRAIPSAGLPGDDPAPADRIAELEERLARLESGPGYRERGRHLMNRLMPPEAGRHFRNAGREQLLGIRSIVDFWIDRVEAAEERAGSNGSSRESIDIE